MLFRFSEEIKPMAAKIDAMKLLDGAVSVKGDGKAPPRQALMLYKQHCNGASETDLAVLHGLELGRVKKLLGAAKRFVLRNFVIDVAVLKAKQHLELESAVTEAKQAWRKSKGEIKKTTRKFDAAGNCIEESVVTEQSPGDINYLKAAAGFMKEQRELWPGANAPKAQAITNAQGTDDPKIVLELKERLRNLPAEQLQSLGQVLEGVAEKTAS